jgi:hypothetical protein
MDNDGMVMRWFSIDRDVDAAVLDHAKRFRGHKAAAFRLFLETGLAQVKAGVPLPARVDNGQTLRMCYWEVQVADKVRGLAFHEQISEGELISRIARLGMTKVRELTAPSGVRDE